MTPGRDRLAPPGFDPEVAFSRNLGWTTEWEQLALRAKRVAIAGLGGVGGGHLLALSRLGIGAFSIADLDTFDTVNLNRQAGATASSMGRPKIDVLAEMALQINPELRLSRFPGGVTPENVDAFLAGCDLFVDGLDFFVLDIRALVFARCAALGIPAVTAAPIGMGVGFLAFRPGGQTFDQYFGLAGQPETEQYLRFLMGVAPKGFHRAYLVDDTRVDLAAKRGPSTGAACTLCAGVVATQAVKILLGRGGVPYAPQHLTFDAYTGRSALTRLRLGMNGPVQRLKLSIARRIYGGLATRPAGQPVDTAPRTTITAILDAARWAPSGDNTQPWRFELLGPDRVAVSILRDGPADPYDYRDREPTLLSVGMLLESLRIAASDHGRAIQWSAEPGRVVVTLTPSAGLEPSPLLAALPMRSVERRAMGRTPLTPDDKAALQDALGPDLSVTWHEPVGERMKLARLGSRASDIRLRAAETFAVHQRVIDWTAQRSPHGIPAGAVGLNRPTLSMMRWAMARWQRMDRMNAVFGTGAAALQLDLLPAFHSAAFFSIRAVPDLGGDRMIALLRHGERLQRFWLTATRRGLAMQPALATLIFADHGSKQTPFTTDARLLKKAAGLATDVAAALGPVQDLIFLGRIGQKKPALPGPRSIRRPLSQLLARSGGEALRGELVGPEGAIAGDERPGGGLLPAHAAQDGADVGHGGLADAVVFDGRTGRDEVDGRGAEQAQQAGFHGGAPMRQVAASADLHDAAHQA